MANYLYNGVELPELPQEAQNATYACICQEIATGRYWLYFSAYQIYRSNYATIHYRFKGATNRYYCSNAGEWKYLDELTSSNILDPSDHTLIWTKKDMLNESDNSVYMAGSDPVPVGGATPEYAIIPTADYKAACDAIRAKTGKTDLIKSGDMAAEIENVPTGGGMDINGVVKEYQVNAGASVNAGDFVEFVTKWGNGEFNDADAYAINTIALSENRMLVVYSDIGNSCYVTAVVFTIGDASVSISDKFVWAYPVENRSLAAVALSDSKVLVAYGESGDNGRSFGVYAMVLTIDGTNISGGDNLYTVKTTGNYSPVSVRAVALSDSKVFLAYSYSGGTYNYGYHVVLTIDGDVIGQYGNTQVHKNTSAYYYPSVLLALTSYKVLVISPKLSSSGHVTARVYSISDTTITGGTSVTIDETNDIYNTTKVAGAVALSDSKVLVAYGGESGKAVVLTLSGTTIIVGEAITFRESKTYHIAMTALTESKALVSYYGTARVLTWDGTTISAGEHFVFNPTSTGGTGGGDTDMITLSSDTVLVVYDYGGLGLYNCLEIDGTTVRDAEAVNGILVQPATNRLHNVGVAKTSGAAGETVEVYCVT